MFVLSQNLILESFHILVLVGFFDKINLAELNEHFFERLESSLDIQRAKEKSSGNPGHDILELCNVLVQVPSAIRKTELDI